MSDTNFETLRGRYDDLDGRPYVEALVILPRLGTRFHVSFLVSNGVDDVLVSQADLSRSAIEEISLAEPILIHSLTGESPVHPERAVIVFAGKENLYAYDVEVLIQPVDSSSTRIPSVLGRSILDRWRMTYDPSNGMLSFKIVSADEVISPEETA